MLTLEKLGLSASVDPLSRTYQDDWFEYPGYFHKPAHCQLEVYRRESGEGYIVVIATELAANDGASITNASESLAVQICKNFSLPHPQKLILIEHYYADSVLPESYSLVRFQNIRRVQTNRDVKFVFEGRSWLPLEKSELERLIGGTL